MSLQEQVHEAVWKQVDHAYWNKGTLNFCPLDTGLGKTTGFRKAIKRLWDTYWSSMPVLIMVPTRQDAEAMYLAMEELEADCAGVWTDAHDPSTATKDEHFTPSRMFTKTQAGEKKCLIVTHNAGKSCQGWVGRRDLVFVDEDPKPVSSETVEACDFTKARDEESKAGPFGDLFANAHDWAEAQETQGLTAIRPPEWVEKVLGVSPCTRDGEIIRRLAEAIKEGRAFQTRGTTTRWTMFKYDLPFQDRTIIYSATASLDGYQFGTHALQDPADLPRVNYSAVTFHHKDWPVGVPKYHRKIMDERPHRDEFFDYVRNWIRTADSKTLIVCPKSFRSDIEAMFPAANVTNYGRDVGSNEYRECTRVYLVSENHKPQDTHRGHWLGHSGVREVTDEALVPVSNTKSKKMKQITDSAYSVDLKQMVARGNLRNVDDTGLAGKTEVHCMIDKDRFLTLMPRLFPRANLKIEPGSNKWTERENRTATARIFELLNATDASVTSITAQDLLDRGIKIKGAAKKEKIKAEKETLNAMGWIFVEGKPGRYSQPSEFRRI